MSIEFCTSEVDARTKWCPLSRMGSSDNRTVFDDTFNRAGNIRGVAAPGTRCIASECMMWRWVTTNIGDGSGGTVESSDTHGYCGAAGVPWALKR